MGTFDTRITVTPRAGAASLPVAATGLVLGVGTNAFFNCEIFPEGMG